MFPQTIPGMRVARNAMCLALLVGAAACATSNTRAPSYPVPDVPGLYAVNSSGDLQRLDGDREWEAQTWSRRSNFASNTQFVINEPALSGQSPATSVELWKLAWVRSEINAQGRPMPVPGDQWSVAPIREYSVPFRYESPAGQTDVVRITPTVPLEPGLYAIRVVSPVVREARVGVGWNTIDQQQYSARHCVDRYPAEGNIYRSCATVIEPAAPAAVVPAPVVPSGNLGSLSAQPTVVAPAPAPAGAQPLPVAAASQGLQIALADPVRRNDGLLLQGVVINSSNQVLAVPTMQGSLETATGQEVRRWVFRAPVASLAPGQRTNFSTEVRPLPAGVARANVAFVAQ
jgi:hypothetical protein